MFLLMPCEFHIPFNQMRIMRVVVWVCAVVRSVEYSVAFVACQRVCICTNHAYTKGTKMTVKYVGVQIKQANTCVGLCIQKKTCSDQQEPILKFVFNLFLLAAIFRLRTIFIIYFVVTIFVLAKKKSLIGDKLIIRFKKNHSWVIRIILYYFVVVISRHIKSAICYMFYNILGVSLFLLFVKARNESIFSKTHI